MFLLSICARKAEKKKRITQIDNQPLNVGKLSSLLLTESALVSIMSKLYKLANIKLFVFLEYFWTSAKRNPSSV